MIENTIAVTNEDPKGNKGWNLVHNIENIAAFIILLFLAMIPVIDVVLRKFFHSGIEGSNNYTAHLVLLITFVGGMITAREKQHLAIAVLIHYIKEPFLSIMVSFNSLIAVMITTAFGWSALSLLVNGFGAGLNVGFIPVQFFAVIIPVGFFVMAVRFITTAKLKKTGKLIASIGFLLGTLLALPSILNIATMFFGSIPSLFENIQSGWPSAFAALTIPGIIILILAGLMGAPLFVVLGGIAYLLFTQSGGALEVIPNEAYTLLIGNSIPAIPLFTLVGFVLAESKAGERLIRLFKALFGWMPGGMVIVAVLVSAFFTTFTGASGVTILALGGVLFYILSKSGSYKESFSTGLLTAVGSIGILLPPSLPVILYGSQARINIFEMFVGGLIPGIILVLLMAFTGVFSSLKNHIKPVPFSLREALSSIKGAFWEIMLPVIIIALYFTGIASIVETAAIAVLYVIIIEVFVAKDIKIRDLPKVSLKAVWIIGGILVILGLARGLSYFIVDAQVPTLLASWIGEHIHSKIVFLLLLNLALIIAGMFLDVYSSILVLVPLIIPLGQLFGIHPVQLGVIFLINMEHGMITPPLGLNLYFSSYCFNKPLLKVCKDVLPFWLIQLTMLILVTFVPWLSTFLLDIIKFK